MDRAINVPCHGKNVFDGLNATDRRYFKGEIELIFKLASIDTTDIGVISSASKDDSIKFVDHCLRIINNKEGLNGIKVSTKMKKIQSQFKYK